ncbi:hypothetical protein F511_00442 [Dorcoceras hygrometricum]|uniref:Uncharacterized protein n=1 Tax=Dorcoceras hygrometricum TaxID=472368 RepID=A0A2Z7BHM9_9LAMI|nr:hypothetical protein F511_00442 [Dorcoceras hygrometricum]
MGAAISTVYYNLKLRHPTIEMPIIDYDLAVLIQPMLMMGISIGVTFNVIFADWMVTVLLIILFIGEGKDHEAEYTLLPGGPSAILKRWLKTCQIPVSFSVSGYQAICLCKGWRKIESKGDEGAKLRVLQLIAFGFFGVMACIVGGLLGLGGVGISDMIEKIERHEYMGLESVCK